MNYLKKLKIRQVKGKYKNPIKGQIIKPKQVYQIFQSIKDKAQETLIVVYLNYDLESIAYNVLSTGSRSETTIDFDEIYGYGFVIKARYYILIHNHPSGQARPSSGDRQLIESFKDYANLKMRPLDFIIIGDKDFDKNKKSYWSLSEEQDSGNYLLGSVIN